MASTPPAKLNTGNYLPFDVATLQRMAAAGQTTIVLPSANAAAASTAASSPTAAATPASTSTGLYGARRAEALARAGIVSPTSPTAAPTPPPVAATTTAAATATAAKPQLLLTNLRAVPIGGGGGGHAVIPNAHPPAAVTGMSSGPRHLKLEKLSRIVFVGNAPSGKSTLCYQLLHAFGRLEQRTLNYVHDRLQWHLIVSMAALIKLARAHAIALLPHKLAPESDASAKFFDALNVEESKALTPAIAAHIQTLWRDPCVKHILRVRSLWSPALLYVDDSVGALFDRVTAIATTGYEMAVDDFIRTRVTTTGMNQNVIATTVPPPATVTASAAAGGPPATPILQQLHVLDVGGRKSERKKWRPAGVFSLDTCAYIYVVAVSDFDELTYDDPINTATGERHNRLSDALVLFQDFLSGASHPPPPTHAPIFLLLNKTDLLRDKLSRGVELSASGAAWAAAYGGGSNADHAIKYITSLFQKVAGTRKLHPLSVCGVDPVSSLDAFRTVFQVMKAGSGRLWCDAFAKHLVARIDAIKQGKVLPPAASPATTANTTATAAAFAPPPVSSGEVKQSASGEVKQSAPPLTTEYSAPPSAVTDSPRNAAAAPPPPDLKTFSSGSIEIPVVAAPPVPAAEVSAVPVATPAPVSIPAPAAAAAPVSEAESTLLSTPLSEWSSDMVEYWLSSRHYAPQLLSYVRASPANAISGGDLMELDEQMAMSCGVSDVLHRKKLVRAVTDLVAAGGMVAPLHAPAATKQSTIPTAAAAAAPAIATAAAPASPVDMKSVPITPRSAGSAAVEDELSRDDADRLLAYCKTAEVLGEGSFGQVYRTPWPLPTASNAGGPPHAVKLVKVRGTALNPKIILAEINVLRKLKSPAAVAGSVSGGANSTSRCVQFIGANTRGGVFVILTEYLSGGNLSDRIYGLDPNYPDPPSAAEKWRWAIEIGEGLTQIHGHTPTPIVHRDLKPTNILLDKSDGVKLVDFGFAHTIAQSSTSQTSLERARSPAGTDLYKAPEVWDPNTTANSTSSDIYSAGIVLHELFCGEVPWGSMSKEQLWSLHQQRKAVPPLSDELKAQYPELIELLTHCTRLNPLQRPTAPQLVVALTALAKHYGVDVRPSAAGPATAAAPAQ